MGDARLIRVDAPPAAADAALVAFVAKHAANSVDVPLARVILSRRVRERGAILDVHADGARVLLAALIDRSGGSELVVLGLDRARLDRQAVDALIATAERRVGAIDLALLPDRLDWRPLLEARGWQTAESLHTLERVARPLSSPARPLPPGWRWTMLTPARVDAHRRLVIAAFASLPAAYSPSHAELVESARGTSILLVEGQERAFASVRVEGRVGYVNALGRDPEWRGRGLGELALERALALLFASNVERVELEVLAGNRRALELYQRHELVIARTTPVMRRG